MNGAAADYCDIYKWYLFDVLGYDFEEVAENALKIGKAPELLEKLVDGVPSRKENRFFISYPRARPQEADFVENLIRRRNGIVYRDEEDLEPAAGTQEEISKNVSSIIKFSK